MILQLLKVRGRNQCQENQIQGEFVNKDISMVYLQRGVPLTSSLCLYKPPSLFTYIMYTIGLLHPFQSLQSSLTVHQRDQTHHSLLNPNPGPRGRGHITSQVALILTYLPQSDVLKRRTMELMKERELWVERVWHFLEARERDGTLTMLYHPLWMTWEQVL